MREAGVWGPILLRPRLGCLGLGLKDRVLGERSWGVVVRFVGVYRARALSLEFSAVGPVV